MTEQLDYVAKIRAKGCATTGITEDIARELHARPGRRIMAIVELKVEERHEKAEGQNRVDLVIEQVEPAMEQVFEDHLRELTRTTAQNRRLKSDDETLDIETPGDLAQPLEAVIADGKAQLVDPEDQPHQFLDDGTGDCEVCEGPKGNPIHAELEDLPEDANEPADQTAEDPVPVA